MKKVVIEIFIISIFVLTCTLGCSQSKQHSVSLQGMFPSQTEIHTKSTDGDIIKTSIPTFAFDPTPTIINTPITKIDVTQIPVDVSDLGQSSGDFLYQNVKVKLNMDISNTDAYSYVNLDDLSDNDMTKSDMELIAYQGRLKSYFLNPANYATFYFSGETSMDFQSCVEHLAEFRDFPAGWFYSGRPICVLTNEGRIAVVNYIKDSQVRNENTHIASLEFNITVYNETVR